MIIQPVLLSQPVFGHRLINLTAAEASGTAQTLNPPILSLNLVQPSDGLPLLQDWLLTAGDIYRGGYEGWRETIECRLDDPSCKGKAVRYCCLTPTKGVCRSTILIFALTFTFLKLKDMMSEEETADFARPAMGEHNSFQSWRVPDLCFVGIWCLQAVSIRSDCPHRKLRIDCQLVQQSNPKRNDLI